MSRTHWENGWTLLAGVWGSLDAYSRPGSHLPVRRRPVSVGAHKRQQRLARACERTERQSKCQREHPSTRNDAARWQRDQL